MASPNPPLGTLVDDEHRSDTLLRLLEDNRQELVFWRERNWSALKAAVTVMATLAGATILRSTPLIWSEAISVIAVIVVIAGSHHAYQKKNVNTYDRLKEDREALLVALGLDTSGRFLVDAPLVRDANRSTAGAAAGAPSGAGTPLFIKIVWSLAGVLTIVELMQPLVPSGTRATRPSAARAAGSASTHAPNQ
jgi:hypothetical protein